MRTHGMGLIGVALLVVAVAALAPSVASAGIAGSPHDFSDNGASSQCIACHSPHFAGQTRLIWNHKFSTNTFAWTDVTTTLGGTLLPANISTWSGPTKLCMSCHDGSVAVGDLFNNSFTCTGTGCTPPRIGTVTGNMNGNHPVALPYPFGQVVNTYNAITTGANVPLTEYVAAPTKVKLFSDGAPTPTNRGLECSSCHDAHNPGPGKFLRDAANTICVNCHIK